MIQWMLAIWFLVPLPFLKPTWTSGSSQVTYCWSLVWRILSITLLVCETSAIMRQFEHSLALPFFGIEMKTDLFQSCDHRWVFQICWHIECNTFTASSFRIWNSSTGIPSRSLETPKYSKVTAINNHHYHQEAAGGAVLHTRSTRNMAFAHSGLWAPWFLESFFLLPVLSFPSSLLTQYFWRPFFPLQCSRLFRPCTLMSSPGLPESRGTRRDLGGKAWTWSWFSPAMAALPGMRGKRN